MSPKRRALATLKTADRLAVGRSLDLEATT